MDKIINDAITVKIIANTVGSNNKAAITNTANDKPITKIAAGNPSLYMANRKALYTKANPNSCCMMDKIAGKAIIAPAIK
jgi:hypothetical protein